MPSKAPLAPVLLALLAVRIPQPSVGSDWTLHFDSGIFSLCITAEFVESHPDESSLGGCGFLCGLSQRCQAFTMSEGICQLFVFDKCSKSVRDCSCSRRGQVFVKRQPGLEPGALCPSGYDDELCGVKYRMLYDSGSWLASRQRCESEAGLVIMADVMDATEMEQVEMLYNSNSSLSGKSLWLGGLQLPGSQEPAGGWVWASCGGSISDSLWGKGEPTNSRGGENVTARFISKSGLADLGDKISDANDALCKCVSPFE